MDNNTATTTNAQIILIVLDLITQKGITNLAFNDRMKMNFYKSEKCRIKSGKSTKMSNIFADKIFYYSYAKKIPL